MHKNILITELEKIVGSTNPLTASEAMEQYSHDATRQNHAP